MKCKFYRVQRKERFNMKESGQEGQEKNSNRQEN